MDPKTQRQSMLLGALVVVLVGLVVFRVLPAFNEQSPPGASTAPSSSAPSAATRVAPTATQPTRAPGSGPGPVTNLAEVVVHLDAVTAERPLPRPPDRNPFRFGEAARPVGDVETQGPIRVADAPPPPFVPPTPPAGPPPPPPIPYKFIGLVTAAEPTGRVAVLSDGRGVYHGREGEIVEGQYRIVHIGEESIQIEYADGRGRQTIRLSGS